MKFPYQEKNIKKLKKQIEEFEEKLEIETHVLLQYIKDKADLKTTENQITKRNLLFIDINNANQKIFNLKRKKNQFGGEIQERSIRQYTNM